MKLLILLSLLGVIVVVIIVMIILLATSVGRYARYWQQQNAAPTAQNALVYVALGDSAAQSIGASSPQRGYVGLLAARLAQKYHRPVHIVNLSHTGAKIHDVLTTQMPQVAQYKPDFVTVEIGANDMAVYNPQTFEQSATELFTHLPQNAIVADLPYFGGRGQLPLFGNGRSERNVESANAILQRLVAQHGFTLAPLYQTTRAQVGRAPWHYAIDYFHPNDSSYQVWADAFWQRFQD